MQLERRLHALLLPLLLAGPPALAAAATPAPDGEPTDPDVCGTPDLPQGSLPRAFAPGEVVSKQALMLCVTFPNIADPGLPTWVPAMAGEGVEGTLEAYYRIVSEGAYDLGIEFERQPAPLDGEPYMADHDDSYYAALGNGWSVIYEEILLRVQANHALEDPDYLANFDYVFIVFNGFPYPSNWGGIAGMSLPPGFPSAFSGSGYSQRLLWPGWQLDGDQNRTHGEWVAVHEHGHNLGLGHTTQQSLCHKKHGRYAVMQANVPHGNEWGYKPYHILRLIQLGWFDRVVEQPGDPGESYNVTLTDVRRGGLALKVPIVQWSSGEEYYLVTNHQGSDYDADYPGTGLLVWHVRDDLGGGGRSFLDLELASGMFDGNGLPDPVAGSDELDDSGQAHAGDFWQGGSFDELSNPNTSAYQPIACPVQKAPSGIALENIVFTGPDAVFDVVFTTGTPAATAVVTAPAETFLGLDCAAAQDDRLALAAIVQDVDGTPLNGVPYKWVDFVLVSQSPGALDFCAGDTYPASYFTSQLGEADTQLYHACGGGLYQVEVQVMGVPAGTSATSKLRTPDLNADGTVDISDLAIWANPSGPVEDDIRDLDFDLVIDGADFDILAAHLGSSLEPDANIWVASPLPEAELAIGTTTTIAAEACFSDGQPIQSYNYILVYGSTVLTLGTGPDLTTLEWLVNPPAGDFDLVALAFSPTGGSAYVVLPLHLANPRIAVKKVGNTPLSLPNVGDTGTVSIRLRNNEPLPVSGIEAALGFPSGELAVVGGPTPAGPYSLSSGEPVVLTWTVQRVSGSGGDEGQVDLRLEGFPDVLKSKTFPFFGPSVGGDF